MSEFVLKLLLLGFGLLAGWWIYRGYREGQQFISAILTPRRDKEPILFWMTTVVGALFSLAIVVIVLGKLVSG